MTDDTGIQGLDDGSAWDEYCEQLKRAGQVILENAPDNPFDRAEGYRYLSRLAGYGLRTFIEQRDPATAQYNSLGVKIGLDNPDYVYGGGTLSGEREYLLRGVRNDAHRLGIGTYYGGLGTEQGLQCSGYLSDEDLAFGADGRFEIALSCEERPGNWLPMKPETNQLTIRQTLLDRRNQTPGTFELVHLGDPAPPAPLDPEAFVRALSGAGRFVEGTARQFIGWTNNFAERKNQIHPVDPSLTAFAQGDPSTSYNYGYFELASDEALWVELDPPACEYWNLQVANHWLESLDFEHYSTNFNQHTSVADTDGQVRIAIAGSDPGVSNWIDTAGHARGTIALRWVGGERPGEVRTRVVKLAELRQGDG